MAERGASNDFPGSPPVGHGLFSAFCTNGQRNAVSSARSGHRGRRRHFLSFHQRRTPATGSRVYSLKPVLCQPEQPSVQCLLRLNHDLVNIFDDPTPGAFIEPEDNNVTIVHAVIVGADKSCEGGFHFMLKFRTDCVK
ncbi:hypothetical protein HPB52_014320 [Rhipicephalus sanguineus]|uniref:Uncharacterized protein n=1 Tax=Rhipicephalus sanguineus TaxID=34632 RepID=A0A9D4YPS5_RHISA|nr:hypothetical protein HPB52_014320 [Rhipicephalus sanguineus]